VASAAVDDTSFSLENLPAALASSDSLCMRVRRMLLNSRYAALFARCIINSKFPRRSTPSVAALQQCIVEWSSTALSHFGCMNGLAHVADPTTATMQALYFVLNAAKTIPPEQWSLYGGKYGMLTDLGKLISARPDSDISLPQYFPRFHMSEASVAMAVSRFGIGAAPVGPDGFEQTVVDFAFLSFLVPAPPNGDDGRAYDKERVPLMRRILLQRAEAPHRPIVSDDAAGSAETSPPLAAVKTSSVRARLRSLRFAPGIKFLYGEIGRVTRDEIRAAVLRGEVVVLCNAPRAPFADIIVITRDKVILIQCTS
jgi:hypothetical protein